MLKSVLAAAAAVSFLALGACTQETRVEDEPTAEQSLENAGNELEQAGENAAADIEQAGENAEQSIENATDDNPSTTP
jgi:outer membrane murein-binding lipoprotein Lpp